MNLVLLEIAVILLTFKEVYSVVAQHQRTFSKDGGIYLHACSGRDMLYSGDTATWMSCNDALEYTWTLDLENQLIGMNSYDKNRLIQTNGYCPQLRCQLGNVSNSSPQGQCPEGLCFMKIENGAVSFGACCYRNGAFNSHHIMGYLNKSQPTPKPIYKHNRIVLGENKLDESFATFINANEVYPNIIATQCPLLGYPADYENTLDDVKTMIVEQNISMWISLAPVVLGEAPSLELAEQLLSTGALNCNHFQLALMRQHGGSIQHNTIRLSNGSVSAVYWNISYTIKAYVSRSPASRGRLQFTAPDDSDGWAVVERPVEHLWYMRWRDFSVPPPEDEEFISGLVSHAAAAVGRGRRIAVNCLSGRGRSGSLITMVVGRLTRASSVGEVVDIVVRLRRSRDGLVELPRQFNFIVRTLGLGNLAACDENCRFARFGSSAEVQTVLTFVAGCVAALALVLVSHVWARYRRTQSPRRRSREQRSKSSPETSPLLKAAD